MAAQSSYKVSYHSYKLLSSNRLMKPKQLNEPINCLYMQAPIIELEFLANYLTELTQTEYGFLKFLPSLIAASAVYLAKWTLDQDEDPWVSVYLQNIYTSYYFIE